MATPVQTHDLPVVVIAPREIDATNAGQLHATLLAASGASPTIVVDLSETTFCDAIGVETLLRAWRRARADGGYLILAAVGPQISRVLDILGVDGLFPTCGPVETAVSAP